jgi:hypothetical protein
MCRYRIGSTHVGVGLLGLLCNVHQGNTSLLSRDGAFVARMHVRHYARDAGGCDNVAIQVTADGPSVRVNFARRLTASVPRAWMACAIRSTCGPPIKMASSRGTGVPCDTGEPLSANVVPLPLMRKGDRP